MTGWSPRRTFGRSALPGPGSIVDEPRQFTEAQRRAIARSREARLVRLAPLHAEIEAAVVDVGWRRAKRVIAVGARTPSRVRS